MTKKWSSTASLDGQTKRQASKSVRRMSRREVEAAFREIEQQPPEPPEPGVVFDGETWRHSGGGR